MPIPPQQQPEPAADARPQLALVAPAAERSVWRQPRAADGSYVDVERRALPALTSLRFFAAMYVVVHHLINMALLATQGADADRAATWYLAWGTQGHVGVTFFFVLSGFILAWCYHRTFAVTPIAAIPAARRRFWVARVARVWPLHAAMFVAFVPLVLLDMPRTLSGLAGTMSEAIANVLLLHAWVPVGGPDGLSDTFNAPSWTLSVEALFYLMFPLIAMLLVRRWRWGIGQLSLLALGSWIALGIAGAALAGTERGDWIMRVFPPARLADFVIGVALGLIFVQLIQRRSLAGAAPRASTSAGATAFEGLVVATACAAPLAWTSWGDGVFPETLGVSWFYLPVIASVLFVLALERGAISRRLLAARPLVWLGEVSYALYLVHLFILLAAYKVGAYDRLGVIATSVLVVALAVVVSGVVHARFERPARTWMVQRLGR